MSALPVVKTRHRRWPWVVAAVVVLIAAGVGVEAWIRQRARVDMCKDVQSLALSWRLLPTGSQGFTQWYITNDRIVLDLKRAASIDSSASPDVRAPALRLIADWGNTTSAAPALYGLDLSELDQACAVTP